MDGTLDELAQETDSLVDEALVRTAAVADALRRCLELIQNYSTARQLALAEEQKRNQELLKTRLEIIAAVLLVPTLVAGVYGANTSLPGKNSWAGFAAMLALMTLSAVATWGVLRYRSRRRSLAAEPNETPGHGPGDT